MADRILSLLEKETGIESRESEIVTKEISLIENSLRLLIDKLKILIANKAPAQETAEAAIKITKGIRNTISLTQLPDFHSLRELNNEMLWAISKSKEEATAREAAGIEHNDMLIINRMIDILNAQIGILNELEEPIKERNTEKMAELWSRLVQTVEMELPEVRRLQLDEITLRRYAQGLSKLHKSISTNELTESAARIEVA
ncbi:hypothetical protein HYY72_04290 [Candidatus Woesearchaeota archaeon]|nr:hypothetical protein [Candidatus Woesearchaeota archaeon]